MYPSVNIVIPTWNGLHLLKQSLDAIMLASHSYPGKSWVTVVDNGSMDRTADVIIDYYPQIQLVKNRMNTGFGAACNQGALHLDSDLILFLNNDIYVESNFIELLVEQTYELENFFSICPQTNYWEKNNRTNKVFSSSINFSFSENKELIQHWAVNNYKNIAENLECTIYGTGAALLVDRKKFLSLNGFDHIYGLAYWEDVDICVRAWKRAWPSYCTSEVVAWHMVSATAKTQSYDAKTILMKKNYIIFQMLHLSSIMDRFKFLLHMTRRGYSLRANLSENILGILKRVISDNIHHRESIDVIIERIGLKDEGWSTSEIL